MGASTPIRDGWTDATNTDYPQPSTESGDSPWHYTADVVHYEDAPDECTIYPTNIEEDDLLTTWISAQEGSYVSLAEMC